MKATVSNDEAVTTFVGILMKMKKEGSISMKGNDNASLEVTDAIIEAQGRLLSKLLCLIILFWE